MVTEERFSVHSYVSFIYVAVIFSWNAKFQEANPALGHAYSADEDTGVDGTALAHAAVSMTYSDSCVVWQRDSS